MHSKPAATSEAGSNDQYEQEADDIAAQVVRALGGDAQNSAVPALLSAARPMIQRQVADETLESEASGASESETAATEPVATAGLIVEDDAEEVGPGQMKRSEFLSELQTAVCAAADQELASAGSSTEGCPYVEFWFGFYSTRDSRQIERAIHKYAPEAASATSVGDYIAVITDRVRRAVVVWATTGEVTGVPEGAPSTSPGTSAGEEASTTGSTAGTEGETEQVMPKSRKGGITKTTDPRHIRAHLGGGRPIESGVRSRMESAFSYDFSRVRIHTDANAANLSSDLNARAFTIGHDVAFAHNEYKPGTIVGDAIMAHELAHVVQQGGASAAPATKKDGATSYESLERDADQSALGAVLSLWSDAKGKLGDLAKNAMPRLQSGLTLSRCQGCEGGCSTRENRAPEAGTPSDAGTPATTLKGVTNADGKGWLMVKFDSGSTIPPLPQFLKVNHTSTAGGREKFTIMESGQNGRFIGSKASVKLKADGSSFLASGLTYKSAAKVTFDIAKGEVTYGSSGPASAITQPGNPTPTGTHDLEIADEPHPGGEGYEGSSVFAKTWFRIGHSGDRYLHPGSATAGCTTVTGLDQWTSIYNYLINSRKDDKNVGTIEVK